MIGVEKNSENHRCKPQSTRFGKLVDSAKEASQKSLPNAQAALTSVLRENSPIADIRNSKEKKIQNNDDSDIEEAIDSVTSDFATSLAVDTKKDPTTVSKYQKRDTTLLTEPRKPKSTPISRTISPLRPRAVPITELHPFFFPSTLSHQQILPLLPHPELLFFDTETTGIAKSDRIIELAFVYRNYITLQERQFYALVNPQGKKSSAAAFEAHKIPPEMLQFAKPMSEVLMEILSFLRSIHSGTDHQSENHAPGKLQTNNVTAENDTHNTYSSKTNSKDNLGVSIPIVAHNAHFDYRMLHQELCRVTDNPSFSSELFACFPRDRFLCSYQLARGFNGIAKGRNSLSSLCEQFDIDLSSRAYCHGAMQDTLLLAELYPYLVHEARG